MRRSLAIATAVAGVAGLIGVVLLRQAPVVAKGHLLDFLPDGYVVSKVRFAGAEIYVDEALGRGDYVTSACLALFAAYLVIVALRLRRLEDPTFRTLLVAAAGALYLVGDDLLSLHETIGHNIGAVTTLPGVDHPDDAIMGFYVLVIGAFCWIHRDLAPAGSRIRTIWIASAIAGFVAETLDMLPFNNPAHLEEGLEAVCALGLLVGAVGTGQMLLARAQAAKSWQPATDERRDLALPGLQAG